MNRFPRQLSLLPSRSWGILSALALCGTLAGFGIVTVCSLPARAQERPAADAKAADGSAPSESAAGGALNESEASLERRYQQFERTLLQMAEYLRKTEPERADLLIRAIGRSKENRISQQMEAITQLLKKEQFGDAIGDQQHLVGDLKGLLELLQSEDRRHQLEQEKAYYESLQKEVTKLTARERELRRATERGGKLERLGERQGGIGKDAQSLLDKIEKEDASRNGPDGKSKGNRDPKNEKKGPGDKPAGDKNAKGDKKSNDDKKSDADKNSDDKKSEDGKQADASAQQGKSKNDSKGGKQGKSDGKNADGKKSDGKSKEDQKKSQDPSKKDDKSKDDKQSDSKNSEKGDSKKQDPQGGKSQKQQGKGQQNQEGEQGEQQEQQEGSPPQESEQQDPSAPKKTPGRSEIEAARRAMRQAEEELKRLESKKGMEHEDQAIRKLAEARAQLEKVLRQLREEEQQIILASLEARFAKMLVMQLQIHVDTMALHKTPKNAWTAKHFGRSRELSVEEETIASEAEKALTLLKEEGSSVAFPQGVEQVRDDMLNIARRLSGNDVGEFTQSVERDVIESLEEMVTALQNEIEKRQKEDEKRRQQKGQKSQNGDQEKELVQQLGELKMLRSLQFRVNRRTKQIGRMIKGEEAGNDNLARELSKLARRQAEIQEATYIIATGRNR
ncbi:MAG TPA: hypothetical protein VFG04_01145 [Planctomycetaceae bacterium]|jgi:hypothetical protein|nr:hypothetical protein [Planctomycetaceae bacterium]